MVKNRHEQIADVGFAAPVGTPTGVEVMSLADLRARVPVRLGEDRFMAPQRLAFHQLLTLTSGALWHTVDFTGYALEPGAWLWVRPGQVQQWGDITRAEGTLILFENGFLDPASAAAADLDEPHTRALHIPDTEDRQALQTALAHLELEFRSLGRLPLDVHVTVLRHVLAALVLRLTHLTAQVGSPAPEPDDTFVRFRNAVERDFTRTRTLDDYARALGYSPRTLSRATLTAAGVNAKEFIDRRVILEAKRLLAHGDDPATRIAAHLGFSSATNFSKYFHQRTGQSPIAFRVNVRGKS
ncbi:helix-turn-helix transcriptional regulator [Streptomyces sp. 205]|uniref:Helix-turn-helix transcriptional regulator n=2 Tax=Streptomyces coffeae TaxID=621382 RepID=A0ABS1NER4_9ACTN|nr:AraC family transcriptional regulator [Streptomyces coffeae]MBL1098414.1 helix-turn-helix transcriptional regulator [Streptomyces coffeae]